ncbi:MAG: hypothetical protein WED33_06815 [Bacteroidia bacterium]
MSKINLTNYEAWLLDYSEGNLSPEDTAELLLFLQVNPEIEIDLNELDFVSINHEEEVEIEDKSSLYKGKNQVRGRFEELCLAYYDKDISASEKNELDHLLAQFPSFEKEFIAFGQAYLQPEYGIDFKFKSSLKKEFIASGSFDDLAVKSLEGTISLGESAQLKVLVSGNSGLMKQMKAFEKTILIPDSITYPNKNNLYREDKRRGIIYSILAIAASIAIVFSIISYVNTENSEKQGIAVTNPEIEIPIREALEIPADSLENIHLQDNINPKIKFENQKPILQQDNNSLAQNTTNEKKINVKQLKRLAPLNLEKFELPSDFIAFKPSELKEYNTIAALPLANESNNFLSTGQFLRKKASKLFKKNNIDIETPLKNIQENGLSDIGFKSLEKVTKGKVSVDREANSSRITSLHFFGLTYNRSTN